MSKNYVDKEKLHAELTKYVESYNKAIAEGKPAPKVNNYIGDAIWQIANGLSTTRSFINYTFREDMVMDGVENVLKYIHNFDPENSKKNPFGYFTQIIYFAFLRKIDKEKKQTYVKYKVMENSIAMNTLSDLQPSDSTHFAAATNIMDADKMTAMAERYEGKSLAKKKTKKGVEKFIGADDGQDD